MSTRLKLLAILFFLSAAAAGAQSPSDGHLEGRTYVNTFFHIAYAWPSILQPEQRSGINLPNPSPRHVEFYLFAARQGSDQFGVLMIAEKLRSLTADPKDFRDAADLLSRIKRGFDPAANWKPLAEGHLTNADGLVIDEFDYVIAGEYSSAIVVTLDGYLVVARCNARSAADLKAMTDSLVAMRRTPKR